MPPHPWVALNVHLFALAFLTNTHARQIHSFTTWDGGAYTTVVHRGHQNQPRYVVSLWCLGDGQIHIFHFLHFKCFHYFKNCELYFYIVRVWALCVGLHVFFKILSNLAYRRHTLFEWNWLIWKTKRRAQGQRFLLLDCCCYDSNSTWIVGQTKRKK